MSRTAPTSAQRSMSRVRVPSASGGEPGPSAAGAIAMSADTLAGIDARAPGTATGLGAAPPPRGRLARRASAAEGRLAGEDSAARGRLAPSAPRDAAFGAGRAGGLPASSASTTPPVRACVPASVFSPPPPSPDAAAAALSSAPDGMVAAAMAVGRRATSASMAPGTALALPPSPGRSAGEASGAGSRMPRLSMAACTTSPARTRWYSELPSGLTRYTLLRTRRTPI